MADGLRKLRKSCKEKKLMAKYLPGDYLVAEAQAELVADLKKEFMQQFGKSNNLFRPKCID